MTEPYRDLFLNEQPAVSGEWAELIASKMFTDLGQPRRRGQYDLDLERTRKGRIEVKLIRAAERRLPMSPQHHTLSEYVNLRSKDTLVGRALFATSDHCKGETRDGRVVPLGNQLLQQSKPAKFDYMLALVIFLDRMRVYLCPSEAISPTVSRKAYGKIKMTAQHGNNQEGVFNLNNLTDLLIWDEKINNLDEVEKQNLSLKSYIRQVTKRIAA